MSVLAIAGIVIGIIVLLIFCAWAGILGFFFDILGAILGGLGGGDSGSSGGSSSGGGFGGGDSGGGGGGSSSDW